MYTYKFWQTAGTAYCLQTAAVPVNVFPC